MATRPKLLLLDEPAALGVLTIVNANMANAISQSERPQSGAWTGTPGAAALFFGPCPPPEMPMKIPSLKEVVSAEEWQLRCELAAAYRQAAAP